MINCKINTISMISILALAFSNCSSPKTDKTKDAALALLMTAPKSKVTWKNFKSTDNANIAYKVVGNQATNATTVIVLHGMGFGSKYLESPIKKQLGDKYKLVFYDQRYVGNSVSDSDPKEANHIVYMKDSSEETGTTSVYPNVTVNKFVEDLENLRKELVSQKVLESDEKINLLGHFWGGRLAMEYAVQHEDRVKSLSLVNPMSWGEAYASSVNIRYAKMADELDDLKLFDKKNKFDDPFLIEFTNFLIKKTPESAKPFYDHFWKLFLNGKGWDISTPASSVVTGDSFQMDSITSKRLNPIQTALEYDVGVRKSGFFYTKSTEKPLDSFPKIPVLIMHGKNDIEPWQYSLGDDSASGNEYSTDKPTPVGGSNGILTKGTNATDNTFRDTGINFGKTGLSIKTKLTSKASQIVGKLIDNCGHFPFIEQPSEFKTSVEDFLGKYSK